MSATELGAARQVAVVTGASSGIGAVFARQLAARGHDLVLVARRHDPLNELAAELKDGAGVCAQAVSVDLASSEGLDNLIEIVRELPRVETLVNNAGFGYMGNFVELPVEKHLRMLAVHATATVRLTYAVLPAMVQARHGTLINVSSLAAYTVGPGQALYNSTKAFVKSFTESLHMELEGTGVRVQALCPGMTRTGFHDTEEFADFDRSQMPNLWMSAEQVVQESLDALRGDRPVCVPGVKNRVLAWLFRFDTMRKLAGKKVRKKHSGT